MSIPFDELWKELLPGEENIFKQRLEDRNVYDLSPKDEAEAAQHSGRSWMGPPRAARSRRLASGAGRGRRGRRDRPAGVRHQRRRPTATSLSSCLPWRADPDAQPRAQGPEDSEGQLGPDPAESARPQGPRRSASCIPGSSSAWTTRRRPRAPHVEAPVVIDAPHVGPIPGPIAHLCHRERCRRDAAGAVRGPRADQRGAGRRAHPRRRLAAMRGDTKSTKRTQGPSRGPPNRSNIPPADWPGPMHRARASARQQRLRRWRADSR